MGKIRRMKMLVVTGLQCVVILAGILWFVERGIEHHKANKIKLLTRDQVIESSARIWSDHYGVEVTPNMIKAKMWVESRDCTLNLSDKGAIGCLQVTKATAKKICGIGDAKLLANENINIDCGTQIYAYHLAERHDEVYALVEYNGGWPCLKLHLDPESNGCAESEKHWRLVLTKKNQLDEEVI
jgi:hypothetical protein